MVEEDKRFFVYEDEAGFHCLGAYRSKEELDEKIEDLKERLGLVMLIEKDLSVDNAVNFATKHNYLVRSF